MTIKIALGTTNPDKKVFLEEVLIKNHNLSCITTSFDVRSNVSDQPLTKEETITGSINRAKNCFNKNFDISVGMEAGLIRRNEIMHLFCAVTLFDGKTNFTGVSNLSPIPEEVSQKIINGESFGIAIREYYENHKNKNVFDLITRERNFKEAINNAYEKNEMKK